MTRPIETAELEALQSVLIASVLEAGRLVMDGFSKGCEHELKADLSPVTETDRAAEAAIARHLRRHFPAIPIVAEEAMSVGQVPPTLGRRFFLVDPLDGTREFISGLTDFTVNIGLIEDGRPVCGVVLAPAYGELFAGSPAGAFKWQVESEGTLAAPNPIRVRPWQAFPTALVSRSRSRLEADRYLVPFKPEAVVPVGSSLKFCRIAEGAADLYPCLGRTMEWDTAAGQAVLEAAGGHVTRLDGVDLTYAKRGQRDDTDFANPHFVATGAPCFRRSSDATLPG